MPDIFQLPANANFGATSSVAVNSKGNIIVLNRGPQPLMEFDANGKFIKAVGKRGPGNLEFNTPHSIAVDAQGRVLFSDSGNHRIRRIDTNGMLSTVIGTGVDAVGVDETVDPHWANQALPAGLPVQGNLDPLALIAGGRAVEEAVDAIRAAFADRPHIFNLGHGILPDTPIAHVEALLSYVRKQGDRS